MLKKDKKIKTRLIIEIGILVFLIILVGYFAYKKGMEKKQVVPLSIPGLENCKILTDNCNNKNYQYYYMCDIGEEIKNCAIYDCGREYKSLITKQDNKFLIREYPKINSKQVNQKRENCQGKVVLLERRCIGDKLSIKVKVSTKGECPIQGFLVKLKQGNYSADFEKRDDIYNLDVEKCGDIVEIIAIGKGGFSIK
ncbi:MAG: hypothetical protein U9P88_00910 [Patescibacteria group bacterium]|nr:hypothetical protein [Patescibacteria group bacterium]